MTRGKLGVEWDAIGRDIRYTIRTLRRDVGFTLFALAIIGFGIGANTAVFSIAPGCGPC